MNPSHPTHTSFSWFSDKKWLDQQWTVLFLQLSCSLSDSHYYLTAWCLQPWFSDICITPPLLFGISNAWSKCSNFNFNLWWCSVTSVWPSAMRILYWKFVESCMVWAARLFWRSIASHIKGTQSVQCSDPLPKKKKSPACVQSLVQPLYISTSLRLKIQRTLYLGGFQYFKTMW